MKRAGEGGGGLDEWRALAMLRGALEQGRSADVELAIGDDCAVLGPSPYRRVWTTDACLEGVHFRLDWLSPADVAWKSLHAAVSDIAAMGARPVAALSHVTLSRELTAARLRQFARAQAQAARDCSCPIIGGNLAYGKELQVVTSVLGEVTGKAKRPLLRSGARPGDEIWLVGEVGLAGLGLRLLTARSSSTSRSARRCLRAFRRPRALVEEGLELISCASACLDVSDGLVGDAGQLARSSGVRLVFDQLGLLATASPHLRSVATHLGVPVLDALLEGGEDYALLATGPRRRRPPRARVIGWVEKGQGVFLSAGEKQRELRGGFRHAPKPR